MTVSSSVVADSYRRRAQFCRAETADARRPRLLRGLLDTTGHVAEIPCGTGHFLTEYAHAGAAVTLVDACPDMLEVATGHADDAGLPADRVHPTLSTMQQLSELSDVDLVVLPGGALNQLARQTPLAQLLAGLRSVLRPGVEVLAQVACTHPGGGIDTATFYDPHRQHGVWFADRWFRPAEAAGAVLRRRRQYRRDNALTIEFDYRNPAGDKLHTTTVELALPSVGNLADAFTAAGLVHVRALPGHGGLSEFLATTPSRSPR
ncbi:MAG: class I SAM-dependent methyltransferase [Pseudonocardia sp.]